MSKFRFATAGWPRWRRWNDGRAGAGRGSPPSAAAALRSLLRGDRRVCQKPSTRSQGASAAPWNRWAVRLQRQHHQPASSTSAWPSRTHPMNTGAWASSDAGTTTDLLGLFGASEPYARKELNAAKFQDLKGNASRQQRRPARRWMKLLKPLDGRSPTAVARLAPTRRPCATTGRCLLLWRRPPRPTSRMFETAAPSWSRSADSGRQRFRQALLAKPSSPAACTPTPAAHETYRRDGDARHLCQGAGIVPMMK